MSERWVDETLYPGWGQRFRVRRELVQAQSAFQHIHIFESESHGRVMLLDGAVQITEADEFAYQEMIAHVPLFTHPDPRRVLIIGAGDGGVLRRVLQHPGVEHALMVEIDGEVVRLAREFLPGIAGTAWDDPRADVRIADGIAHVAAAASASVDVIIVDSTDPVGVGEVLFSDAFYQDCARVLTPAGVIVTQSGVPFMQSDELREGTARRRGAFPFVSAYVVAVPTYVGGFMTLGIASRQPLPPTDLTSLSRRAAQLTETQRYWTPGMHQAAFHLPPYIAACLQPY